MALSSIYLGERLAFLANTCPPDTYKPQEDGKGRVDLEKRCNVFLNYTCINSIKWLLVK